MTCDSPYPSGQVDVIQRGIERLINQYQDSENFKDLVTIFLQESAEIRDAINDSWCARWLDEAAGANLDVLGALVGQSRIVADVAVFFGYEDALGALGYGDGRYWNGTEPLFGDRELSDPEYKIFIKARILSNESSGTAQELGQIIFALFGKKAFVLPGNAIADVIFTESLTTSEKLLISFTTVDPIGQERSLLPISLGVGVNYLEFNGDFAFGYADNSIASGYDVGAYVTEI